MGTHVDQDALVACAIDLGATRAVLVETRAVKVRQDLAQLCLEPRCENYARSPGCPPHVGGPEAMRHMLMQYRQALFFSIEVPSEVLASGTRRECFQLLHEIAAGIESQAKEGGHFLAKAYAGGSCKEIFCHDQAECRVLARSETCRHPNLARPSMSGFGIDVGHLVEAAGWRRRAGSLESEETAAGMTSLYGMVLLS